MKKNKKSRAQVKRTVVAPAMKAEKRETKGEAVSVTPFNWLVVMFVAFMVAHSVIIYAANMMFPDSVVLGTNVISPMMALFYSMAVFTLISVGAMPVIEMVEKSQKTKFSSMQWMLFYFVINFVGLWLIARFAEQLGLGLSSWKVAAVLAIVFDIVQGVIAMSLMNQMKE